MSSTVAEAIKGGVESAGGQATIYQYTPRDLPIIGSPLTVDYLIGSLRPSLRKS